MNGLNTMFKRGVNNVCNTTCLVPPTIARMHEQMKRLYEAAQKLRGIEGQSELARVMNTSPQAINNWEARGISKLGMVTAQKLLGCSVTWLSTGEGSMVVQPVDLDRLPPGAIPVRVTSPDDENPNTVHIQKVRMKAQAGFPGFVIEPDRRDHGLAQVPRRWVEKHGYVAERLYAIEVHGESMEPTLYDGDIVVVNTADTKPVDGHVYVFNYEGEVVVKRLERNGPMWVMASDNQRPQFRPRTIRDPAIEIIGRVVRKESERI